MPFDPFEDFETRGYLRNVSGERDPEIIKGFELRAFIHHLPEALRMLRDLQSLDYQSLLDTHRVLFSDVYPWAGTDRNTLAPDLDISRGGVRDMFALPSQIQRAADYAFSEATTELPKRPGHILGLLAHAHPFLECNGRTIFLVHHEMLARVNHHLAWSEIPRDPFIHALTDELLQPDSGALDQFLGQYVRYGSLPIDLARETFNKTFGR